MNKKIKILHLEDLNSAVKLVDKILNKENLDFESLVVDSKDKFIKELKEFSPDIILADHFLPSFNSYDALTLLQETDLKIPFILVTANMPDELAVDLIRKGADDYILKDRLNRLPSAIQNALETYRLRREKEVISDELLSSQLHLKEAQAVAKVGSWETDLQTFNVKWSDETHRIFETDPKKFQVTHEAFYNFIHPEDRDKVKTTFENSFNSQTPNSIEHRIITTNGTLKHIIENWKILRNAQGHPVRAIGTCQDITGRKIAEIDLLESREELQTVFNASLDAIIIIDEEGKITKWDVKAELLFGWKEEEVIGTLLSDTIIPPGLREAHKQGMNHFFETGEGPILNKTIEVHALKKDKTEITISLSICPTRAKNKYQFIGFIRDITERKIAEERLIDSELKLKEAQALGHISNWEVNLVTNIHTWSEEFYNIFGIKREDISPSPESFLSLLHPDDVSHVSERVTKTFQTNEAGSLNSRFIKKDGSIGSIYSEWKFEFDKNKKPVRLYGILQDITESRRAEEKIRTSEDNLAEAQRLAKMGSWNYDFKRDILTWSEELYNVFDTDKETFIETHGSFLHLIDPMDREFVLATGKNTQATGEPFEIEYNITTTKGEHRVIQERGYGEKDKQGNVVRLFGTAQNITERKKSSDALQKALTDLNKILDSSLDVICTINGNGEFVNVSTASQQVWGYKPEELIGSKFMKLVYDEDAEVTAKAAETILSGTQVPTFENRYVHKSGRIVPILWSMNWDEELQLMFCIAKDVTEKKRLKKAVETERDQFFDMFLNAPSAIGMLKGTDHVFEMANPLYLQLTGKKDVIGKTAAELFPEAIEQGIIGMLDHVYHTGETHIGTDVLLKVDKEGKGELTDFYTNFVCQAYRNGMGEIAGVFFFMNIITEQILSRKAIEKSEKQYRQIVETAQEGIWLRDAMNRTTFVNNKLCEILEYSEEEMMGKEIFYFMNETWKKVAAAAIERRKKGISENFELIFITKSGVNIWTNIASNPLLDENGVYNGTLSMVTDITEKKKLEELLEKSNKMARIGSWEYNILTQAHYWSPITREIFEEEDDLTPDLQASITNYKSGASRSSIANALEKAIKDGTPWDLELQIVTAKGKELWVRDIGEAEFINGKCIRLYGSFQDIDARKKAEIETLKVFEEKNIILESIGDAFFAIDKEWTVTYWNKEAEKMLLVPKNKILGNNLWDIFSDSIGSESYKKYHEAIETNEVINFEDYYAPLDKWFEISAYPSVTGLSVFLKDETDRKLSDMRLSALNLELTKHVNDLATSNRELEEFAYVASHDLQEPLRMVIGFLGQIEKKYKDVIDDKGKQYIHFAVDGAKRMRQIILDLLEFSRIGRTGDTEKHTDLNDLVQEVITLCQKQIKETKAIIRFKNLPSLVTNQTSLRQVFQNLISNAVKYHVKGKSPVINISAEERETHWQFAITDNGIGIEAEYFNKIFLIFQRLHNKDEYSGTGIGLAVCKKIIENLGGEIWLESEMNKGSTFYFTILKKQLET